jgi:hypothetical protein
MVSKLYLKHSGAWKEPTQPYVKQAGVWVPAKEVWANQSGTWHKHWPPTFSVRVLMIAGGGGVSNNLSGGGAGGVLHGPLNLPIGTPIAYTVGSGGGRETNGQNTTLKVGTTTYTAFGGGGGRQRAPAHDGGSGGSSDPSPSGGFTGGKSIQTTQGTLTGYGHGSPHVSGTASAADCSTAGGGAGGEPTPNSNMGLMAFPVQYALGGKPITLEGHEVASGGSRFATAGGAGYWHNHGRGGIAPGQAYYQSVSRTGWGDGGSGDIGSGNGGPGRLIVITSVATKIFTPGSGTFVINPTGTIT